MAGFCLMLLIAVATAQRAAPARADDAVLLTLKPLDAPEIALTTADLQAIGETRLVTGTPWTEGPQTFTGVTGRQLLAALQARGVTGKPVSMAAIANNGYRIIIPIADFDQAETLIAFTRNGAAMPVRDKGPLWIVFPYDEDEKYRSESYKSYSIWGLVRLELQAE
jgi:hypothetical protein